MLASLPGNDSSQETPPTLLHHKLPGDVCDSFISIPFTGRLYTASKKKATIHNNNNHKYPMIISNMKSNDKKIH